MVPARSGISSREVLMRFHARAVIGTKMWPDFFLSTAGGVPKTA